MRILLVEVGSPRDAPSWTDWFDRDGRFGMPSVGLVSLASLVRPGDEVRIHDEKVDGPLGDVDADVAGLSYKTAWARRAWALADRLRARGVRVVLGGVDATLRPGEAARHADAVVVGEAEAVWTGVLDDLAGGATGTIYRAPAVPALLDRLPPQRVDLLRHGRYQAHALQSARGCSFPCEFCPTRAVFGDGYRLRDVDAVEDEVRRLLAIEDKPVFFTENVFGAGEPRFVEDLTGRLAAMGARYAVFCDWFVIRPELVRILAAHGCRMVGINVTGRDEPAEEAALQTLRDAGIGIWGYFMFGFEEDGPGVFDGAVAKARRYGMSCATLTMMAPYDGTPMRARLVGEGRILQTDADLYDQSHVVIEPRGFPADELARGYARAAGALADLLPFERAIAAFG